MRISFFLARFFWNKGSLFLLISFAVLSYLFLDAPLSYFLHSCNIDPLLFKICSFLINPLLHLIFWTFSFLSIRFFSSKTFLIPPLFEIMIVQWISIALVRTSKIFIGRSRPLLFLENGSFGFFGPNFNSYFHSFPSGHTMTAFTLSYSLALFFPRLRIPLFFIAFILASSRIVLFDHYLSDLFGTALIGITLAKLTHYYIHKTHEIKNEKRLGIPY